MFFITSRSRLTYAGHVPRRGRGRGIAVPSSAPRSGAEEGTAMAAAPSASRDVTSVSKSKTRCHKKHLKYIKNHLKTIKEP